MHMYFVVFLGLTTLYLSKHYINGKIDMEIIRKGTKEEMEFVHKKLDEFNSRQVPHHKEKIWESFNLFSTDGDGKIIAGITASLIMDSCISIHALWVDEKYRHKGVGSRLLSKLENDAKSVGAQLAHLDTFDFQALGFYQKNGYEIFGTLDGSPCSGHKRYYMRKQL